MKIGDSIHVKDLPIASDKDIDLTTDRDAIVVSVIAVHNQPVETDGDAETEEEK